MNFDLFLYGTLSFVVINIAFISTNSCNHDIDYSKVMDTYSVTIIALGDLHLLHKQVHSSPFFSWD